jgi:LMBR1 domain-containing protein 1
MVDIWLIIVTVVCFLIMVILNLYIIKLYIHPDDKGFLNGFFEKLLIMLSSCLLWSFIMLLPLDIANSRGEGAGFNIEIAYQILFAIYIVFLVILLPFTLFLYETDEEISCIARFFKAIVYTILIGAIVLILGIVAWGTLKKTEVTVPQKNLMIGNLQLSESKTTVDLFNGSEEVDKKFEYELPVFIFGIIFLIFIGWFIFVMFAGIGLSALPMDLILEYVHRYFYIRVCN